MAQTPIVRKIKLTSYRFPTQNVTTDLAFAAGSVLRAGQSRYSQASWRIHIYTDAGVTGEYISGTPANREQMEMIAPFLIGRNALDRELFYRQSKMILRKHDRMGIGPLDIALWDLGRARCSMRQFTSCWADTGRSCPVTPARTTPTARPTD